MNFQLYENVKSKLENETVYICESNEEYYFLLGQLLVAVFEGMGGVDRYRREYNYLTNPSLACNVQCLNQRILNFLRKADKIINNQGYRVRMVCKMVMEYHREANRDEKYINSYEEAFNYGLNSDNMLS